MQCNYLGIYRATVVGTGDPSGKGRIRVQVPQLSGAAESRWAEPVNPGLPVPSAKSIVWISFNGGDLNKPVYFSNTAKLDTGWVTLSYPSGYIRFSSNTYPLQIRRIDGQCYLRGRMTRSAGNISSTESYTDIIPVGFRPLQSSTAYHEIVATCGSSSTIPSGVVRCQVSGAGTIFIGGTGTDIGSSWIGFGSALTSWFAD
jgi:hypothetical protein